MLLIDYYNFKCLWKMHHDLLYVCWTCYSFMIQYNMTWIYTFGVPNWDARFVGKPWKATNWVWKKVLELNLFPGLAKSCLISYAIPPLHTLHGQPLFPLFWPHVHVNYREIQNIWPRAKMLHPLCSSTFMAYFIVLLMKM